jgi:predicted RNA-binding Zn-ribbon protein involved in translation (DUF1610 family)
MSEPEIARRCPTCGASIREVALFCPQCGNPQPSRQARAATEPETTSKNTAPLEGKDEALPQQSLSDTIAIERPEVLPTVPDESRSMSDTMVIERRERSAKTPVSPGVRKAVGAKIQRATSLARDVEGDVIHRVQKVREVSSVVLDEAGNDPGLRFVLVAVIVFVLFLVIVLLNKFIS